MSDQDFEVDPAEQERELRDQAMAEDGFSDLRLWMPTQQNRRTVEERFWSKVVGGDVETCWLWTAAVLHNGYGQFRDSGVAVKAHRWAYENLRDTIPAGLVIDHLCRNRACVNPWHLEPVTQRANVLRGESPVAKNAVKTHCVNGHPFDAVNTGSDRDGNRFCRTCARDQDRALKQRRKTHV